jgi:hypothetical protein
VRTGKRAWSPTPTHPHGGNAPPAVGDDRDRERVPRRLSAAPPVPAPLSLAAQRGACPGGSRSARQYAEGCLLRTAHLSQGLLLEAPCSQLSTALLVLLSNAAMSKPCASWVPELH